MEKRCAAALRGGAGAPVLLASLLLACATSGDVVVDTWSDLSGYRTWDWQPQRPLRVVARHRDPGALDERLALILEEAMGGRGFAREPGGADLWLTYHADVRLRFGWVEEPRAAEFVPSHHASPSYWVEGSERKKVRYETVRLVVGLLDGRGMTLWRATVTRTFEDGAHLRLDEMVEALLERLPPREDRGEPVLARAREAGEGAHGQAPRRAAF